MSIILLLKYSRFKEHKQYQFDSNLQTTQKSEFLAPGFKRWKLHFGSNFLCVFYRYDIHNLLLQKTKGVVAQ